MAEQKGSAPSFTKLLRGAAGPQENPSSTHSHPPDVSKKETEHRRRPILLPFRRREGEEGLFSISYREWAFLLGALLLLFGGMGLIRVFSPKELAQPSLAPFGEVTPGSELSPEDLAGTRPPGGGDEEVIAPLTARDTTRLVQPPSGFGSSDKKEKPKSAMDNLKDSLWGGLKEAERRTPPRPSLGGLGSSLGAALAGVNAGPPSQGMRWMSPEEISARLRAIPTSPPGGREGMRLGYSGAQRVPRTGGGRRTREESSADRYGKMREAYTGPYGAEKAAAQGGAPFGEGRASGEPVGGGGGATVGGEAPRSEAGKTELGNYNVQRPPWAMEEWQLQHWWERAWKGALAKGLEGATGKVAEGVGAGFGEGIGNFIKCGSWDCAPPPPPVQKVANIPVNEWFKLNCPLSAIPQGQLAGMKAYPGGKQNPDHSDTYNVEIFYQVVPGDKQPPLVGTVECRDQNGLVYRPTSIFGAQPPAVASAPPAEQPGQPPAATGEFRPGSAADIQESLGGGAPPASPGRVPEPEDSEATPVEVVE